MILFTGLIFDAPAQNMTRDEIKVKIEQLEREKRAIEQAKQTQAAQNQPRSGESGMSITILTPQATGLEENQNHLPALIQGEFVSNFSSYSTISVLDWERLDEIYLNLLSDKYDDKAREGVDLGNLAHTTHTMGGKIIKTPTGYNLQMSITRTADKVTVASFSGNFSFWELNNLTGIRRASLDLLQKVGVTLTAKAQHELTGAATENHVTAQNAFARGITAQRQGTEVAALSYYFQAAAFDPSLMEAVNRSSILNTNISSGNMGDNVRNDIAWRRQWVERLTETEKLFDNFNKIESMPYTLFYTNDIKQGAINYQNETVTMSIETYLYGSGVWTLSIERTLQAVWDGLNATGRKDTWQLGGWPQRSVTDLKAFERRNKTFSVEFEVLNSQNKVIGKQILQAGGFWELNWSGRPVVNISAPDRKTLHFQNVDANEITDKMTIRVANVNEKDAESAAIDGILQIRVITKNQVATDDRFQFSKGEILGFANRTSGGTELVIPRVIWGDPVISIGDKAFMNLGLTNIVIPNSVRSIGSEAFQNNKLASVVIPNSVTSIGDAAFNQPDFRPDGILSITIGANVNIVGMPFRTAAYSLDRDDFEISYNKGGKKAGTYTFSTSHFTDRRDGQKYRAVRVGNRLWMAENLNFSTSSNSWCYKNDNSNCNKYGRLYAQGTARTVCPSGWRLPNQSDWNDLIRAAGGNREQASKRLRSKNNNGTDDLGWSALPGGDRFHIAGFRSIGQIGYWWSDGKHGSGYMIHGGGIWEDDEVTRGGRSVRCVRD